MKKEESFFAALRVAGKLQSRNRQIGVRLGFNRHSREDWSNCRCRSMIKWFVCVMVCNESSSAKFRISE